MTNHKMQYENNILLKKENNMFFVCNVQQGKRICFLYAIYSMEG